jgi:hypothetical protein
MIVRPGVDSVVRDDPAGGLAHVTARFAAPDVMVNVMVNRYWRAYMPNVGTPDAG